MSSGLLCEIYLTSVFVHSALHSPEVHKEENIMLVTIRAVLTVRISEVLKLNLGADVGPFASTSARDVWADKFLRDARQSEDHWVALIESTPEPDPAYVTMLTGSARELLPPRAAHEILKNMIEIFMSTWQSRSMLFTFGDEKMLDPKVTGEMLNMMTGLLTAHLQHVVVDGDIVSRCPTLERDTSAYLQ